MEPQLPQEPHQPQPEEPASPRSRVRWPRSRSITIIAAVVLALLVGGISAAVADTGSSSSSTSTPPSSNGNAPNTTTPRGPRGPHGFKGFPGFGAMGAIHGELVTPNGSGGYRTVDVQTGTVQAVSTSSITVKSADGFTKTYAVTTNTVVNAGRDGIGTVKQNDKVSLSAVVQSNNTAEATNIVDTTSLGNIRGHWFPNAPKPNGAAPARFGFNA
ncbi:MAG: hypothetical protein JOZ99_08560 [Actinobacteria bacterium]|nr:hypothetical protein [Actinomycetota bacterium]